MTTALRKLALLAHIILSVGWLGAVAAYLALALALALAGLISDGAQMVRAAYLSMECIGWYVIAPFSIATLVAGLVESLGTQWGLFRHWWVLAKLVLATTATVVLLLHLEAVTRMSRVAAETTLGAADFRALRIQLAVHAVGGLLVLLTASALSVYKPWGVTPYGRRKRRERRRVASADLRSDSASDVELAPGSGTGTPRWVYAVGIHGIGLALLFLVIHVTGGGLRGH